MFRNKLEGIYLDVAEPSLSLEGSGHIHSAEESDFFVRVDLSGAMQKLGANRSVVAFVYDVKQTVTLCFHVNL